MLIRIPSLNKDFSQGISMPYFTRFQRHKLALAAAAVSVCLLGLSACNDDDDDDDSGETPVETVEKSVTFTELEAASTDAAKRMALASDFVTLDEQTAEIGYMTILRSGEQRGDSSALNTFGQVVDNAMLPVVQSDGSTTIADSNDFSSLLTVGDKVFAVSQFESRPGAMYLTEVTQDADTGKLSAASTKALDLSGINGIWNPCAGVATAWQTHLGTEEYEPDAKNGNDSASSMASFFGGGSVVGGDASQVNAYYWGFPVEVAVTSEDGDYTVTKHYSMGRFAHELYYVMPDSKTVYGTDDGTNVGLFMYVADTAEDLTAGTLYAMKWTQTSEAGASELGTADVSWIELGHASDATIKSLIDSGITFADIFTKVDATDGACPDGYTSVNTNGTGLECLALNEGMETAAAFLESRRYAGMLGATTELRKEEGFTFNPDDMEAYVAYSEVQYGMEDYKKNGSDSTSYDTGTSNDVKLMFNSCGAVYKYGVGSDDSIGSEYVLQNAAGMVAGIMTTVADPDKINPTTIDAYDEDSAFYGSACAIDGLANPDNISFMPGEKTLFIGEDTGDGHQNDAVWAYNIESGALTRIASTPYGSETTSVYYYPDINGYGYVVSVIQHPYGESDGDKVTSGSAERRSYFGAIGPLPVPVSE